MEGNAHIILEGSPEDSASTLNSYYSISWNEFTHSLSSCLKDLRDDFTDVHLFCDSGERVFQAHKLVLSTSSRIFKRMLLRASRVMPSSGTSLMLYLKGIREDQLENLLNFIYLGEITLHKDDVSDFMDTAQEYEINGLVQTMSLKQSASSILSERPKVKRRKRSQVKFEKVQIQFDEDIDCSVNIDPGQRNEEISIENKHCAKGFPFESSDEIMDEREIKTEVLSSKFKASFSEEVVQSIEKVGDQFICKICNDKSSINRCHIANHIEAQHIKSRTLRVCPYCSKEHRTRHSLTQHVSRNHNDEHRERKLHF